MFEQHYDAEYMSGDDMDKVIAKARDLYNGGECGCWTEVYDKMSIDIEDLAEAVGKPSAYIMASIIDDATDLA